MIYLVITDDDVLPEVTYWSDLIKHAIIWYSVEIIKSHEFFTLNNLLNVSSLMTERPWVWETTISPDFLIVISTKLS